MGKLEEGTIRQSVVDAYGEADRQAKLWTPSVNPHLAERSRLEAIIQSWYAELSPEATATVEGLRYRLEVKARQFQRDLTPTVQELAFKRIKKLGHDVFSIFRATQYDIESHVGTEFLDEFAPSERTGRRRFAVIAKSAPAKLRKAA